MDKNIYGFKNGIDNRFIFGNKKPKESSPLDYYNNEDESDLLRSVREESLKHNVSMHKLEELSEDYHEAFNEISKDESGEEEKYSYGHFVNSSQIIENLKAILDKELEDKKSNYEEYDEYEYDLLFKRLDKAIELINEGYRVEIWHESKNNEEQLLLIESFDIIFFINRDDIFNYTRNY